MAAGRKTREQPERDPREQALKLLRAVKPPLDLDGESSHDPHWLAERLCDSFSQLDGMKAMHTLFLLLMDTFDRLSLEYIHREYYLLDPGALAEDAMSRLFEDLQYDERIEPLNDWIVDCIDRSARICAADPTITWYHAERGSPQHQWMLHKICAIANGLDFDARRLAWLIWGRKLSLKEIERQTNCPIERLEVFIGQVIQQVVRETSGPHRKKTLGDRLADALGQTPPEFAPDSPDEDAEDDDSQDEEREEESDGA